MRNLTKRAYVMSDQRIVWAVIVVLGAVAAGAGTAGLARRESPEFVLALLIAGCGAAALIIASPSTSMATVVVAYPFVSIYTDFLPTSTASSVKDYVLIGVSVFTILRSARHGNGTTVGAVGVLTMAWIGLVVLMALFSQSALVAALGFRTFASYSLVTLAMIMSLRSTIHIASVYRAVVLSALGLAPYLLLKYARPDLIPQSPHLNAGDAVVDIANRLHWDENIFLEAAAVTLIWFGSNRSSVSKRLLLTVLPMTCIILSGNKTALLGLVVASLVVASLRSEHLAVYLMCLGAALVAFVLWGSSVPALRPLLNSDNVSYSGRIAEWRDYVPVVLGRPWGYGTGSVSGVLYTSRYSVVSESFVALVPIIHNSVLAVLLEFGVQGAMALAALVGAVIAVGARLRSQSPSDLSLATGGMALVSATAAEMLISPVILSATVMLYFWLAVGSVGALAVGLRSSQRLTKWAVADLT